MKERLQKLMAGRYGADELSRFINILILIFLMLGIIFSTLITSLALALIIYNYFRMFSKNTSARAKENAKFLRIRNHFKGLFVNKKQQFSQRKTHRFYKCTSCSKTIRVPKGKGKIEITCPSCGNKFIRRS